METTEWHYLPELPPVNKEVLIAFKYEADPIQGYHNGSGWYGSAAVREAMNDGFVQDHSFSNLKQFIYAWCFLPTMPAVPE